MQKHVFVYVCGNEFAWTIIDYYSTVVIEMTQLAYVYEDHAACLGGWSILFIRVFTFL